MNCAIALTLSRMVLSPVICGFIFLGSAAAFTAALLLFFIAAVTDYLDGYVATITATRSPLGAFLDPLADKILVLLVLVTLGCVGRVEGVHCIPLLASLFREIFVMALRNVVDKGMDALPVIPMAKWKTTFQMCSIFFFLCPMQEEVHMAAQLFLWISTVLSVWTGGLYYQQARKILTT